MVMRTKLSNVYLAALAWGYVRASGLMEMRGPSRVFETRAKRVLEPGAGGRRAAS